MQATTAFGQWLKQRRHELDLTQEAIAAVVSCSVDTVYMIESGRRRPSRQMAELLAACLHVQPEQRPEFVLWARGASDVSPFDTPVDNAKLSQSRGSPASSEAPSSALTFSPKPTTALPIPPTNLIGRERQLARVRTLLWSSTVRLLSLIGPPGIGKTRLVLAAASALEADFKDGLVYVPLAPISDPTLVALTLAEGLGIRETSTLPLLDSLKADLRNKQKLLILDNFEHLKPAAPLVTELLAAAPQLKILVTSRSPLHLRGERIVDVPPLEIPDPKRRMAPSDLEQIGSVSLFLERVRDARGDFDLTPNNAYLVSAICARLDGLPLAIELAAAKTRLLTLPELLTRLQRQLALLTGGPHDAPVQQRTLRDALESSFALLKAEERKLFSRLGIFAGPFTLDAAEGVAGATLEGLEAILDQSLVHVNASSQHPANLGDMEVRRTKEGDGGDRYEEAEARFSMLMPVREYALEQLEVSGVRNDLALNHALYYLDLARTVDPDTRGPSQKLWLDRIEAAYNDIRAALDWTLKNKHGEMTLRLAGAIGFFWVRRGYREEGCSWLEQALAQELNAPAEARVQALFALGTLYSRRGEHTAAEGCLTEAIAISREAGARLVMANVLLSLGEVLIASGEYERAVQTLRESLSITEELGDRLRATKALSLLARVASFQLDFAQAIALQEQSLLIKRQLGIPGEIASTLQHLATLALKQGNYGRAIVYAEESAALSSEAGDNEITTYSLGVVGKAALGLGEYERAATSFTKCLLLFVELGAMGMVAFVFEEIARVAIGMSQPAKAARLFGVAEALRESIGAPILPPDRAERDDNIASLRQALGEPAFKAAWTIGRTMTLGEAILSAQSIV